MKALLSRLRPRRRGALALGGLAVLVVVLTLVVSTSRGGATPSLPTVEATTGEFIDAIEIRGEIRPLRALVIAAPMQSGELQLIKLARNGAPVKAGEVVIEFDGTTLRRTVQEKQSELKQAEAEIEQTLAQTRLTSEQNDTELMRATYDIQRAKLEIQKGDTVSRIEGENAKLALGDAEQKLGELQAKMSSDSTSVDTDLGSKRRKREKALFDLRRAETGLANLQVKAPMAGTVNILPNYRASSSGWGSEVEFRQGDRAWPGAPILELPDLSSVHLEARLDETDRGRLKQALDATVRIEAIPGREFKAKIERISVLARGDFSSWPPTRNFDLNLVLNEIDPKIRPGMTAVARIAVDRVANVLIVPSEAVFQHDGYSVVYVLDGALFEQRRIEVARRGREQTIVKSGLEAGERVASRRPGADLIRRSE